MRLSALLEVAAAVNPDRVALTDARGSLTMAELTAAVGSLAAALRDTARGPGPVCTFAVNGRAIVTGMFAASACGRAFAPLNYRADEPLLRHYVDTLDPAVVVADDRYAELLRAAAPDTPLLLGAVAEGTPENVPTDAGLGSDDVALLIFTSGTTSRPKAVTLRHRHLTSYVLETSVAGGEPDGAATLVTTPAYHIATAMNILTSIFSGRRLVLAERFDPAEWLETATAERVTHAFVVPTMLYRIARHMREHGVAAPPALRTLAYGGAPAATSTVLDALELFPGVDFVNAYGLSETSSTIAVLGPDDHRAAFARRDEPEARRLLTSAGRPMPGVAVRISEEGEILVRGAQVSGEYVGADAREGDWFHTGDRGRLEDGYLYVEGRLDDMIIRGGENISPREVEDALMDHPDVRAAAVIGVPDEEWGQRVSALIEAEPDLDVDALNGWLRGRLPGFKCPDRYRVVPDLPRNAMGKVVRDAVREQLHEPAE